MYRHALRFLSLAWVVLAWVVLLCSAAYGAGHLRLQGKLVLLPKTPRCDGKLIRVTTKYQVQKVLRGEYKDRTVLVIHRCPEIPRGPSRYGRGDAGKLRPGQLHRLDLRPVEPDSRAKVDDRFPEDRRIRYWAYRTDIGRRPPRIVVTYTGGGGVKNRLRFEAESVIVGSASSADVLLNDPAVAGRHLRLRVKGDRVEVKNLSRSRVTINDKPLGRPRKITYRDVIKVGTYAVKVSLFLN